MNKTCFFRQLKKTWHFQLIFFLEFTQMKLWSLTTTWMEVWLLVFFKMKMFMQCCFMHLEEKSQEQGEWGNIHLNQIIIKVPNILYVREKCKIHYMFLGMQDLLNRSFVMRLHHSLHKLSCSGQQKKCLVYSNEFAVCT